MARNYDEPSKMDTQLAAIETGDIMHELGYLITEHCIPVRVIAGLLNVTAQTVYLYTDLEREQRPTLKVEQAAKPVVERLKALAAEGKLDIVGSASSRTQQFIDLLMVETEPQ